MSEKPTGPILGGSILIVVGIGLLVMQIFGDVAETVVLPLIGVAFLVGYIFLGAYGLLVPGCIMTGLGVGVVLNENFSMSEGVIPLGLGIGFLAIYVIDRLRSKKSRWWPLIPGGIVTTIGIGIVVESVRDIMSTYWPVLLVLVGAAIIVKSLRDRKPDEAPQPPTQP